MALPATTTALPQVLFEAQNAALAMRSFAQNSLIFAQTNNVDSDWIFRFLDRFYSLGVALNTWRDTTNLNTFATANIPGYSGSFTADIDVTISAGVAVMNWVVTNFPKDTDGYVQAYKINANGSRTPSTFTPAQTAGLQTTLTAFVSTIG